MCVSRVEDFMQPGSIFENPMDFEYRCSSSQVTDRLNTYMKEVLEGALISYLVDHVGLDVILQSYPKHTKRNTHKQF